MYELLLEDEEDLEVGRLLELLGLDFLLLLDAFLAKTGSMVSIRAKNNVPTIILTFLGYFSVAIIFLLKIKKAAYSPYAINGKHAASAEQ